MRCGGGLSISDPTNREGSPPTTNKYARRGDIAFVGGGAILVIGLWIVGGLAYFDTFHTSPPKPVAEKPTPSRVAEKHHTLRSSRYRHRCHFRRREVTPEWQRNCLRFHRQNQRFLLRYQTIRRNRPNPNRNHNHYSDHNNRWSLQIRPR
jgi:hypothetical protein